jgi:hypothetical protein
LSLLHAASVNAKRATSKSATNKIANTNLNFVFIIYLLKFVILIVYLFFFRPYTSK